MMLSEPQTSSGQMARQLSTSSTGSCQFQVGWSSSGDYKEMSFILAGTYSALVYEPKYGGRGGVAGSQPMSTVSEIIRRVH
jgi:hypothetical protein